MPTIRFSVSEPTNCSLRTSRSHGWRSRNDAGSIGITPGAPDAPATASTIRSTPSEGSRTTQLPAFPAMSAANSAVGRKSARQVSIRPSGSSGIRLRTRSRNSIPATLIEPASRVIGQRPGTLTSMISTGIFCSSHGWLLISLRYTTERGVLQAGNRLVSSPAGSP
ncbi:hypothetical protein SDC9_188395 [bioreactor metagenome]|uniref:Uncharacterized protein n=1 Tax=bioreactor metagenome TaxID=1076179 RepID=A0A645HP77_9ZZZZ